MQLEEGQYEAIRRLAHRERISMSEAVRRLLAAGLRAGHETAEPGSDVRAPLTLAGTVARDHRGLAGHSCRRACTCQAFLVSPTVPRVGSLRFYFFSREEARPHVHVEGPDGEPEFSLVPVSRLAANHGLS